MQQPVQQFGDLIEPAPVPFSFHAPGWYVVEALLLMLLLLGAYWLIRYRRRNRYRREALQWLGSRMIALHAQQAYMQQLYEADMLMKRIAMKIYGREQVAALQGNEWISFLNRQYRRGGLFSEADSYLLTDMLYKSPGTANVADTDHFISKTSNWIRYHKHASRNRI